MRRPLPAEAATIAGETTSRPGRRTFPGEQRPRTRGLGLERLVTQHAQGKPAGTREAPMINSELTHDVACLTKQVAKIDTTRDPRCA